MLFSKYRCDHVNNLHPILIHVKLFNGYSLCWKSVPEFLAGPKGSEHLLLVHLGSLSSHPVSSQTALPTHLPLSFPPLGLYTCCILGLELLSFYSHLLFIQLMHPHPSALNWNITHWGCLPDTGWRLTPSKHHTPPCCSGHRVPNFAFLWVIIWSMFAASKWF